MKEYKFTASSLMQFNTNEPADNKTIRMIELVRLYSIFWSSRYSMFSKHDEWAWAKIALYMHFLEIMDTKKAVFDCASDAWTPSKVIA